MKDTFFAVTRSNGSQPMVHIYRDNKYIHYVVPSPRKTAASKTIKKGR